jgi:hypothetical protein
MFHTRIPGAGSFLKWKPSSPTGLLIPGKGFFQAVYERYIDSHLPPHNSTTESNTASGTTLTEPIVKAERIVLGSSNGAITVEMPNIDKVVNRLRRGAADPRDGGLAVKEVGLEGQWVRGVEADQDGPWMNLRGKLNSTSCLIPSYRARVDRVSADVSTLNLSRNLIPSWHDLAALCAELPNLQVLVIK